MLKISRNGRPVSRPLYILTILALPVLLGVTVLSAMWRLLTGAWPPGSNIEIRDPKAEGGWRVL